LGEPINVTVAGGLIDKIIRAVLQISISQKTIYENIYRNGKMFSYFNQIHFITDVVKNIIKFCNEIFWGDLSSNF